MFHNNYIGLFSLVIICGLIYIFIKIWTRKLKHSQWSLGIQHIRSKNFRIVAAILLISFLFYFDFIRDYVFKNLTWRMDYVYQIEQGGSPEKYFDATDSWMKALLGDTSSHSIYYLKYLFSSLFILTYAILTHVILRFVYPTKNALPYIILLYGLGTLMMGLVFSFYFFTWSHDIKLKAYLIAMEIGHFLESSLPTLLLILGFKIYLTTQESKPNE